MFLAQRTYFPAWLIITQPRCSGAQGGAPLPRWDQAGTRGGGGRRCGERVGTGRRSGRPLGAQMGPEGGPGSEDQGVGCLLKELALCRVTESSLPSKTGAIRTQSGDDSLSGDEFKPLKGWIRLTWGEEGRGQRAARSGKELSSHVGGLTVAGSLAAAACSERRSRAQASSTRRRAPGPEGT